MYNTYGFTNFAALLETLKNVLAFEWWTYVTWNIRYTLYDCLVFLFIYDFCTLDEKKLAAQQNATRIINENIRNCKLIDPVTFYRAESVSVSNVQKCAEAIKNYSIRWNIYCRGRAIKFFKLSTLIIFRNI